MALWSLLSIYPEFKLCSFYGKMWYVANYHDSLSFVASSLNDIRWLVHFLLKAKCTSSPLWSVVEVGFLKKQITPWTLQGRQCYGNHVKTWYYLHGLSPHLKCSVRDKIMARKGSLSFCVLLRASFGSIVWPEQVHFRSLRCTLQSGGCLSIHWTLKKSVSQEDPKERLCVSEVITWRAVNLGLE